MKERSIGKMNKISVDRVNQFLLYKQHLTENSRIDDIVQIVNDISGLHATSPKTPYQSLFARTRSFKKEYLDEELYIKRNLGRIRCIRKTIYVLTKEMIPIFYTATKKMVEKASKQYAEFRGFSSEKYEEISKSILDILKSREMTATEIKRTLKIQLDVSAILYLMCDKGLLMRSRPRKYSSFREYFPNINLTKMNEMEAITLLVQHYLSSFGPATENDIVWWTGLSKTQIRQALNSIQKETIHVKILNLKGNFIMLRSDENLIKNIDPPKNLVVNLLPILDPYLMGYKDRQRYLDHKHYDKIFDRSGNATSTILLDGRVIGVWDYKDELIKLFPFEKVEEDIVKRIYLEARRIGKFIADKEVRIKECTSMTSLTQRTAGGVMSPLKDCGML